MKILIFLCTALLVPAVFADDNTSVTSPSSTAIDADADSVSQSGSFSGSQIDSHDRSAVTNYGPDLGRSVANVVVPNPGQGINVCSKSFTAGVGISGLGFGFGVPINDTACNRRADAITARNLGEAILGKEVMCEHKRFFKASYRAGRPCFPDSDMMKSLSDDEMEIYQEIVAKREHDKVVAAAVLESQQQDPISHHEMIRRGKIQLKK